MERLYKPWDTPDSTFGDFAVLLFLCVQCLDGVFTYVGVKIWGPGVEANPLISSAVSMAGLGVGLASAKLMAMMFGVMLHLRRVHTLVAVLTIFYIGLAIVPWAFLFLSAA